MKVDPNGNGEFIVTPANDSEAHTIADASYEALIEVVRSCVEHETPLDPVTVGSLLDLANNASGGMPMEVTEHGKDVLKGALRMYSKRGEVVEKYTAVFIHGSYSGYRSEQRKLAGEMLGSMGTANVLNGDNPAA